jgi:hypothetical protein
VVDLVEAGDLWWNWRVLSEGEWEEKGAATACEGRGPRARARNGFRPRAGTRERERRAYASW